MRPLTRNSVSLISIVILAVLLLLTARPVIAQVNTGELRLKVTDPSGLGLKTLVIVSSEGNQYRNGFTTNDEGVLHIKTLPYGVYLITAEKQGFADISKTVQVRSAIPVECAIKLEVAPVNTVVQVDESATLIDPYSPSSVMRIGAKQIDQRLASLPGRSVQDIVNSQPGWLYEGNAVLHPRGSEYQTQFVIDGIPLTDNRSPSFGPEIEADDIDSVSIYTSGFPAEYGRKMGGVVELNSRRDSGRGLHGQVVLAGGSFDSAGAFAEGQYVWGKNTFGGSASGSMTDHYLNPVVPQNFTNTGTTGDFSAHYERDLTSKDRLSLIVRHELSRYELPNEQIQQTWCLAPGQASGPPCQLQNASNIETMGIVSYERTFSPDIVASLRGMVRDNANSFQSNADSTPILVFQHNSIREGYFKGSITIHHGRHEWKAGVESDNTFLHENFNYIIH